MPESIVKAVRASRLPPQRQCPTAGWPLWAGV